MSEIARLWVTVGAQTDELYKGLSGVQKSLNGFGDSMINTGKKMSLLVTAPIVAGFTAIAHAAMDLEATEAKFNTVFQGMTNEATAFIEEFKKLTPLTTAEARGVASGIQDLLVPMGFAREEATHLTGAFMPLIGALANFNNSTHTAAEVANAVSAALIGEYEPMRRLGVVTSKTAIDQRVLESGVAATKDEITDQMRAIALHEIISESSADAIAAYTEANLDAKTKMGLLRVEIIDVAAELGQSLLPIIGKVMDSVKGLVQRFAQLTDEQKKNILKWAGVLAAIGPTLIVIGAMAKGLAALIGVFKGVVTVVTLLGRAFRLAAGFIQVKLGIVGALQKAMLLMAGPAGWIALAVIAIATIGTAWYLAATESERAIKKMTDQSNAQFMRMGNDIRNTVIEKIEGVIAEYTRMKDESLAIFKGLADGEIAITNENFKSIMEQIGEQQTQKMEMLNRQMAEELKLIEAGLDAGVIATEESAEEMREAVRKKYEDKADVVDAGFAEIHSIMAGAYAEQRGLTETELSAIEGIHEEMYASLIEQLQQHVVDYKGIEALKYMDVKNMSAEQLKQYRDLVLGEHEAMGTDLENNVAETLLILEELWTAGIISPTEYTAKRAELNQQLIEGNIEIMQSEKEMVDSVNRELRRLQAEGVVIIEKFGTDSIRMFRNMSSIIVGNSIVPDMVNAIMRWFRKLGELSSTMASIGSSIIGSLWSGLRSRWSGLQTWLAGVSSAIKKAFDPNQRKSPSLVDLIKTGVKDINNAFSDIAVPNVSLKGDMGGSVSSKAGSLVAAGGGGGNSTIHHKLDLINVPNTVDGASLERVLVDVLNSPQVKRKIDRVNYENQIGAVRGLGA